MSEHIRFIEGPPAAKTKRWTVTTIDGKRLLGVVCWYGPWRRYSFYPHMDTVFDASCLRAVASFCEEKTFAHRSASSAVKAGAA